MDKGIFPDTRWSVVLRAQGPADAASHRAMSELCEAYWPPLYALARGRGYSPEDAEDLTQGFFAQFLAHRFVERAAPGQGRLRWFLLAGFRNHLSHIHSAAMAQKRGGGCPTVPLDMTGAENRYALMPAERLTPEVLYDRHWALALMDRCMEALQREQQARGKGAIFAALRNAVTMEGTEETYAAVAARHGLTEAAVKMIVFRLRERFRELLRGEIADTVSSPDEVDDEIRHLFSVFAT